MQSVNLVVFALNLLYLWMECVDFIQWPPIVACPQSHLVSGLARPRRKGAQWGSNSCANLYCDRGFERGISLQLSLATQDFAFLSRKSQWKKRTKFHFKAFFSENRIKILSQLPRCNFIFFPPLNIFFHHPLFFFQFFEFPQKSW